MYSYGKQLTLSKYKGESISNDKQYRSTVGVLQYVIIIRSEISFSVNKVSQYIQNPLDEQWKAVKRILRYLKGTINHGLHYNHANLSILMAMPMVTGATDMDDRRSTTRYCIFLGKNPILWCSRMQPIISRSSTKAE